MNVNFNPSIGGGFLTQAVRLIARPIIWCLRSVRANRRAIPFLAMAAAFFTLGRPTQRPNQPVNQRQVSPTNTSSGSSQTRTRHTPVQSQSNEQSEFMARGRYRYGDPNRTMVSDLDTSSPRRIDSSGRLQNVVDMVSGIQSELKQALQSRTRTISINASSQQLDRLTSEIYQYLSGRGIITQDADADIAMLKVRVKTQINRGSHDAQIRSILQQP